MYISAKMPKLTDDLSNKFHFALKYFMEKAN